MQYQFDVRKLISFTKEIKEEFGLHRLDVEFSTKDLQSEGAFLLNLRSCLRDVVAEDPDTKVALRQSSFALSNEQHLQRYNYSLVWNFKREELKEFILSAHSAVKSKQV